MSLTLSYGNPNREYIPFLNQESYLDSLLKELQNYPYTPYDSPDSEKELLHLLELSTLQISEDRVKRFLFYDDNFMKFITDYLVEQGIERGELEKTVNDINQDSLPLLLKLKFWYQRVRPYQLAHLYNVGIYPPISFSACSPSYPSGHVFQSKLICEVLGNYYPKYYKTLQHIQQDIDFSRLYLGFHYKSDNDFGNYCADLVLAHPEFKKKYKL
jgi:hypothetical protein